LMEACHLPATDVIRILIGKAQPMHVAFDEGPVSRAWTEFVPKQEVHAE
jgi:hypothetical protein